MIKRFVHHPILLLICCLAGCSLPGSRSADQGLVLGKSAFDEQRYSDAVGYLRDYVQKSPDDGEAQLTLGCAYLKAGMLDEAIGAFKRSTDLNPKDAQAQALIKKNIFDDAHGLLREGKQDAAMRYLTGYLTINPDDVDTHVLLAKEFIKMGSTLNAILSLNKAAELDPDNQSVIELLDYFSGGFHE